jgi:hypothetical protein
MTEIKSPNQWENNTGALSVFLGGSIEMGEAENWQETVARNLEKFNVILLNPRRDDWDSSWVQSIKDPQFNEQVTWELDNQDSADLIVYYFDPKTKAPITLMELGLYAKSNKVFVCCPEGYWRKGNVEMVCDRFEIPLFSTLEELISRIKLRSVIRRR